jgi:hypothetical protein
MMLPLVSSYVFLFIVVPLLDVNATATTTLSTISTCHGGQLQQRNDLLMVSAVRSSVRRRPSVQGQKRNLSNFGAKIYANQKKRTVRHDTNAKTIV